MKRLFQKLFNRPYYLCVGYLYTEPGKHGFYVGHCFVQMYDQDGLESAVKDYLKSKNNIRSIDRFCITSISVLPKRLFNQLIEKE